jgi:hypothetical protein
MNPKASPSYPFAVPVKKRLGHSGQDSEADRVISNVRIETDRDASIPPTYRNELTFFRDRSEDQER